MDLTPMTSKVKTAEASSDKTTSMSKINKKSLVIDINAKPMSVKIDIDERIRRSALRFKRKPKYADVYVNRCIGCGIDMGECNPRQYCEKTECPFEFEENQKRKNMFDDEYNSKKIKM